MGRRGPIPDPKSATSKAGRNSLTRKKHPKPKAKQPAAAPKTAPSATGLEAPASVQAVPAAAAFWQRVAPILSADGRLRPDHVDAFGVLAHLHADIEQLAEQLREEGWITSTDKGQAASPVAKLLRDARRDWVQLARDFGLTAAAAARLPLDETHGKEDDDEEDQVLRRLSLRGA